MGRDAKNEMERIQKGLEGFLDREIEQGQRDRKARGFYESREAPEEDGYNRKMEPGPDAYYEGEEIESDTYDEEEESESDMYDEEEESEPDLYDKEERGRGYFEDARPGPKYRKDRKTAAARYEEASYDREAQESGFIRGKGPRSGRQAAGRTEDGMKNQKKEKKKKKSVLGRLLLILALLAAVCLGAMYLLVGLVYGKMRYEEASSLAGKPVKSDGVTSVLLIGSDSRDAGAEGRSDAMILLSISNKTRTVHMTSLLRDMYVEIPGHEGNRLNAAYAFGGPELLLETIQVNFGIRVNRYVVVNFEAFANLVDAVGGVELELSSEEVEWVNAYLNEYNLLRDMPIDTDYLDTSLSGLIHLNGAQALAYSRNRYIGTDFGRTERQRKVLSEVLKRLPVAAVKNPKGLADGLFPNLTTNLTQMECMQIGLQAGRLLTYEVVQDSIPLNGTYSNADIRGMAVLQVDFEKNREYLRKELYGDQD